MKHLFQTLPLLLIAVANGWTHESHSNGERVVLGVESFVGERGYLHFGVDLSLPVSADQTLGIVAHTVREESGGEFYPSLGAQFLLGFDGGFSLQAHSFVYFPVESQSAWAFGVRGFLRFTPADGIVVAPFFGPTYARVEAIDEDAAKSVTVQHLMICGGVRFEVKSLEVSIFGTASAFDRDPRGLETVVDLQEMTQLSAYENVDGFARFSVGAEVDYSPCERLSFAARYAVNFFHGEDPRHAVTFAPTLKLNALISVSAGVQLLRGGTAENNIGFAALSVRF